MATRVLLIAYMFPPIVDGGAFRPTAMARYLPEHGFDPIVLSRPDTVGLPVDPAAVDTLPPSVRIERTDVGFVDGWRNHYRRMLAPLEPLERLVGKAPGTIADAIAWRVAARDPLKPWEITWMRPAVEAGLRIIDRLRPEIIIATAPPFETLKAGLLLHEKTGVPLIADFRDPWTYGVLWNPPNERQAARELAWERRVVESASKVVVVTPSMQRRMAEAYPKRVKDIALVMNGYEERHDEDEPAQADRFVVSYVGSVIDRRLPPALFEALRRLKAQHPEVASRMVVRFVGPNQSGSSIEERIVAEEVEGLVEYHGPVTHAESRALMRRSSALLHIEPVADYAVSGKLFEYFMARRPVIGIVRSGSDDEQFLHESGAGSNAGPDDPDRIAGEIRRRWQEWCDRRPPAAVDRGWLAQFSRRKQIANFALLLASCTAESRCAPASTAR